MTEPVMEVTAAEFSPLPGMSQVPYLEEWLGAWAMRENEFQSLARTIRGVDVALHLSSKAPEVAAGRGDSPAVAYTRDAGGVATIELRGRMQKQRASLGQSASTVETRRAIRAAAADPEVGAILLVIDSPGGTVAGTSELADDVAAAALQKPVIGLGEDMVASAAFWVGAQCSQLILQKTCLGGSIGTYGVVVDESMAASKEGYKVHVVRAGQFKGAGVPGTEVTADQLADYQREINALNEQFLAGVARGREMSIDDIRKLATGQVWVGQEAVDCGLADGVGSFDQALGVARAASMKTLNKGKKMAAASYQDIVAACPGATPDFICDQLKAGATADAAVKGWMGHQQAQIEQAKKDADAKVALAQKEAAEKIKAAEDKARLAETGVRPLKDGKSEGGSEEGGGSSLEKFNEFVEAKVKLGMRRPKAVSAVSREHPQLHAAVVTEANANRKAS